MTSSISTPSVLAGAERSARCWELAIKIFNTTLTNDPSKIIYISAPSPGYNTATYADVIATARQYAENASSGRTGLRGVLEAALLTFNNYAQVIDVLVQHQPHVTALVWGAIRGLLQVAVQETTISAAITNAISKITREMGRSDEYVRRLPDSNRLQSSVAQLFAQMINYLVRANAFYSASSLKKYAKTGLSRMPTKLSDVWNEINDLILKVEREVNLLSVSLQGLDREKVVERDALLLEEISKQERHRTDSLTSIRCVATSQERFETKIMEVQHSLDTEMKSAALRRKHDQLNGDKQRVLQWLERSKNRNLVKRSWEPGTAEWILHHPIFQDWEDRQFDGCLWVHGIPGCGKSIMASFLEHHSTSPITISHYLQAAVEENSTKTMAVAASVLSQFIRHPLVTSDDDLLRALIDQTLPLLESFSTYEECELEQIWDAFEKSLHILPEFTVIIDALDECYAAEGADKLIKKLQDMSTLPHARVIVLSRSHQSIHDLLKSGSTIEMDETTLTADIELFVQREVKRTPKIRIPVEDILQKTRNHAKGMFLWTKLMLQYLQQASTPRMQRDRLDKFPGGLAPIYAKLLRETEHKLETDQINTRRRIFMLLVAAKSPLTVQEIAVALALEKADRHPADEDLLIDPEEQIIRLCWPFIRSVGPHVQIVHYSMQEFLLSEVHASDSTNVHFTAEECNNYMALKCLYRLVNPETRSVRVLQSLLRVRLDEARLSKSLETLPRQWPLYLYASDHWYTHLVQSRNTINLLQSFAIFLKGFDFIAWVEEFDKDERDMGAVIDVRALLHAWHAGLSPKQRGYIDLSVFFQAPYNAFFNLEYVHRDMPEVAFMAMRRLGLYHNYTGTQSGGRTLKDIQKLVAEGFSKTLGSSHPLTMRSTADWCIERIIDDDRELPAGEALLLETMELQRQTLKDDVFDSYYSQMYVGLAMYYRGKFNGAIEHLRSSYEGLGRILGPNHEFFQHSRLYYAHALAATFQFDDACRIYEEVWSLWSHLHGAQHPLSTMTQCNLGVTYRRMGNFALAERHLLGCLGERQRMHGDNLATLDSALQLALLYRDMGRKEEANAYLGLAEGMDLELHGFERYCHVNHLRALLLWESGGHNEARKQLEELLLKSDQYLKSRALMWVRLSLADIWREQGQEKKALSVFINVVRLIRAGTKKLSKGELEKQMQDAESSLRVARERGAGIAEELLQSKGLMWLSPEAFWIIFGGPAAEIF